MSNFEVIDIQIWEIEADWTEFQKKKKKKKMVVKYIC